MATKTSADLADKLLFSGLKRHVRICDTVLNSSAFLSCDDRVVLMQDLLAEKKNPTSAEIEKRCQDLADDCLEHNMAKAQILRSSRS